MRLLLTSLVIALVVATAMGQRPPARRLITCRVTEIHEVFAPEAQLVINDTIRIDLVCRNHPRLYFPAHKWPDEWGGIQIGKRVQFISYGDGRRWLPVRSK